MTAFTIRRPSRRPLVVVIGVLAIAIGTQVASVWNGDQAGLDEPLLAAPPAAEIGTDAGPIGAAVRRCERRRGPCPGQRGPRRGREALDPAAVDPAPVAPTHVDPAPVAPANTGPKGFDPTAELTRIRADVDFWAARLTAHPNDIVSAVKLAESDVAEARMTGDVTDYLRAEQAADAAIVAQPGYLPAQSMRASILVSLHRFPQARELARWILFRSPADSTALGVLGDASLELGDLDDRGHRLLAAGARRRRLRGPGPRRAARVRRGRPGRRGGRRPRRGRLPPPTRGSRATRSASTTSRWARRSSPPATRPAPGRRSRRPSRSVRTSRRPSSGWPSSTRSTASCRPRSPSSTRRSPRSRCPTRWRAGPTC